MAGRLSLSLYPDTYFGHLISDMTSTPGEGVGGECTMVENPAIPAIDLLPLVARGYQDLGTVRGADEGPARGPIALLAADVAREPAVWAAYRRGLHDTYAALGAAHLAPGPGRPPVATTVVLAASADGGVIGGCRLRAGTDIGRYDGIEQVAPGIAAVIAAREPDGLEEASGSWVVPEALGLGLGTALLQAVVTLATDTPARWTIGLANQNNLRPAHRAGFEVDRRYADLPFPDERYRSTLLWIDHRAAA